MIEGKDPIWETDNYDVVLAGVSTYHRMTNGYLSKLRFKYPEAGEADRGTPYGDRNKLGTLVTAGENPVICLMYVSGFPYGNRDSMDYGSVPERACRQEQQQADYDDTQQELGERL